MSERAKITIQPAAESWLWHVWVGEHELPCNHVTLRVDPGERVVVALEIELEPTDEFKSWTPVTRATPIMSVYDSEARNPFTIKDEA